jgi:hypothetical protein
MRGHGGGVSITTLRLGIATWLTLAAASCFCCHTQSEGVATMIVRKIKKAETFQGVSLYTLLGQMAAKKQFIEQSHPHFEEFWNCHRELAQLERAFDQANKLWMSHQHETRRTNQTRSG